MPIRQELQAIQSHSSAKQDDRVVGTPNCPEFRLNSASVTKPKYKEILSNQSPAIVVTGPDVSRPLSLWEIAMMRAIVLGSTALALAVSAASAQAVYPGYGYAPYGYGYGYVASAPLYDYAAPAYGSPYVAPAPAYTAPPVYAAPTPAYTAPVASGYSAVVSQPIYDYAPGYWGRDYYR